MKKLPATYKAFTILEMLAGMAIAALVLLLGFYGLQLVQKQYSLFQKATTVAQDYRRLEVLLWHDFTRAEWVEKTGDSTLLCTTGTGVANYHFSAGFTLRTLTDNGLEFADTLRATASVAGAELDGKPVVGGLIDRCILDISPFGAHAFYPVRKIYSAQERMNYEQQHER